jgi:hypothetical protein
MARPKSSKGSAAPNDSIFDPRFASFATDPRFRLPSKKHTRTKIDKRFSRMLKDEDFSNTATVDRYGRKLSTKSKKAALQRLYQPEEDDEEDRDSEAENDVEVEDDKVVQKELKRAENYDPARGGGFSSSEDEDEEEEENEEEDGGVEVEETFPDLQAEQTTIPIGEVTSRIAVVNLDWDNIRAEDLYAVVSSFVKGGGRIKKLSVYKSEFGKERMEREEMEGPPREIFGRQEKEDQSEEEDEVDSEDDSDEEDEKIKKDLLKADDGEEFDSGALRQYQLERLRYFYAVVEFSDSKTAHAVYEAIDGTEYLTSANFFDLRFIPDGVTFDDKPRDECTAVSTDYRPTEFVTDALQHSKVKLTWDAEDTSRKEVINRAFTGSRSELNENDLRAYLGSDSSDNEEEDEEIAVEDEDVPKFTKKELARQKMRAALGLSDEPLKSLKSAGPVGDMEITFTAGLSANEKTGGVFTNKPIVEETTAEAYVRKERERKARRKAKAKAVREGRDPNSPKQTSDAEEEPKKDEDLGFDDPFFAEDPAVKDAAAKSQKKEARAKRRAEKQAEADAADAQRAELELLMTDNTGEESKLEHFDINEIQRATKLAKKGRKKGKKAKAGEDVDEDGRVDRKGALQKSFKMNVNDPRFGKLFESHEYAIDTSNPKFKPTEGMKQLLEEGRKKRKTNTGDDEDSMEIVSRKKRKADIKGDGDGKGKADDLKRLVESVKRKVKK